MMFLRSVSLPVDSGLQMRQKICSDWDHGTEILLTGMLSEYHTILHWLNFHAIIYVFGHINNNGGSGKISMVADSIRVVL